MKLSQIILEEYQEESTKYQEIYKNSGNCDYTIKTLTRLTQAYKDALYMEGEVEKVEEQERRKPENMYRSYSSIMDRCSSCNKGTLEEVVSMVGVEGWENHIAVSCRLCKTEGVVKIVI